MDFLKIRRKAKERAAGEAEVREPAAPPATAKSSSERGGHAKRSGGSRAGHAPPPADAPVLRDADLVAGKLAAELQGIAADAETADAELEHGEPDPRFTTWRPGAGERPFIPEPAPAPAPMPSPSEFAVIGPALLGAAPSPAGVQGPMKIVAPAEGARVAAPSPAPAAEAKPETPRSSAAARRAPTPPRNPLDEFFYRDDEELPELVGMPADPEPATSAGPEDGAIEEYLTFELGPEEYAVAIERVREVLKAQTITEVPRAPAGILGVVTVRGEVVAVFDPRRRLGLPGSTPADGTGRIVIVDDGEGPCGLLVDAVASVVRLARGSIEPCPQGIGGASADCLAGIGRERNRLFTVLDLGALLRRGPAGPRGGRAANARA